MDSSLPESVNISGSGSNVQTSQPAEDDIVKFDAAAVVSNITHSEEHLETNACAKRMKHYRDVCGRTQNALELPECAPLVFPDIDRAVIRMKEGKEPKPRFQSGRTWVRDYIDRKSKVEFVWAPLMIFRIKEEYR